MIGRDVLFDYKSHPNQKLVNAFDAIASRFTEAERYGFEYKIEIPDSYESVFISTSLYIVFSQMLSFETIWKPMEKVKWEICFRFNNNDFLISQQKFGLRLFAHDNCPILDIQLLMSKIKQLVKLSDGLLEPYIRDLIEKGDFTLQNNYYLLYTQYTYFRHKADEYNRNSHFPNGNRLADVSELVTLMNSSLELERNRFYYADAMLNAFFGFLEYLCVLLLAFAHDYDESKDNLENFIFNTTWTQKFNRIFYPNNNITFKQHYHKLENIKAKYRNSLAHGGFEKKGNPFFVHFPHVGAVPVALSKFKDTISGSYLPIEDSDYNNIVNVIDSFWNDVNCIEPYRRPMKIIESGLHIVFCEEYKSKYKKAISDEDNLNIFLEKESYMADRETNMDW